MKRTIPVLAMLIALAIPAAANATGNHNPQPPAPKTCACCADLNQRIDQLELVFNQKIDAITQVNVQQDNRLTNLENTVTNLQNQIVQIDQRTTQIINRIDALSCRSNRIYTYRLRTEVDGVPVASVESVTVAGEASRGSFTRNSAGRFVIRADYRGLEAPNLQFRTAMVRAKLANGQSVDLVQYVRLCGRPDGRPNKTPAQQFAGR